MLSNVDKRQKEQKVKQKHTHQINPFENIISLAEIITALIWTGLTNMYYDTSGLTMTDVSDAACYKDPR